MVNRHYQKGTRAERIVRERLESRGWHTLRRWGSKGPYDVLAIAPVRPPSGNEYVYDSGEPLILMVEVKNGPTARMDPAERERLVAEAAKYGALPLRAHYARKVPGVTEWHDLLTGEAIPEPRGWR